jgi:glyoxylase-like metal-dependent hydrolase (beta-lactamase superfamily II)
VVFRKKESNLWGIGTTPDFGIGQRALFLQTPRGNVLWDCISLIDETTVEIINSLGGLDAIAISHPHYYTSMVEWSLAFGGIPIYLHSSDQKWVQRKHANIHFWNGESQELFDKELTLYNVGGHFEGGTILHWEKGAGGRGVLLAGDILQVVPDRRHLSFMYSYPNHIPLNRKAIERISRLLAPLKYDRIYGAWWDRNILQDGKNALQRSAKRYIEAIT